MIAYRRDEIVSASEVARGFSNILNSITNHTKERIAISKNNKLEAILIDIEEYEMLKYTYNKYDSFEKNKKYFSQCLSDIENGKTQIVSDEEYHKQMDSFKKELKKKYENN
jgi:PHD/YefM family antitoxin component YafN of YafNO toxin-antitoxin module